MTLDDEYELPQELWAVFCDRESVFEYFFQHGIPAETAFELAQSIRKGKYLEEVQVQLKSFSIDPTVIEAVKHIRYLFPRSHAVCFGMLQIRLVWLCLHYPNECSKAIDMVNVKEKWSQVLELLEPELTEISFNTWIKPIKVNSVDKKLNVIHLVIDNYMAVDLIKGKYRGILENAIKEVYGSDFEFTIEFCEK